jgi:hypothetical protein
MRGMNALRKLLLTVGASGAALALAVGPVAAAEAEPADDAPAEEPAEGEDAAEEPAEGEDGGEDEDEDGKIALAETPRDRIGLILLGALLAGGWFAATNARRQLKGERPQASGEFRWR